MSRRISRVYFCVVRQRSILPSNIWNSKLVCQRYKQVDVIGNQRNRCSYLKSLMILLRAVPVVESGGGDICTVGGEGNWRQRIGNISYRTYDIWENTSRFKCYMPVAI